jgi:magnesium transporter
MRVIRVEGGAARDGGAELAGPGAVRWLDLEPSPENLAFLAEHFHFHPVALTDCAHEDQRVKFDQYADHLFTVIHRLSPSPEETEIVTTELHAFLTADALVTVHAAPIAEVDAVRARCLREPELLVRGPDFALYLVHDAITDVHFSLVDALTEVVEEIDAEVMSRAPEADVGERITLTRRQHTVLRRRLAPQREVFAALARPGQTLVREQTSFYFRNVMDHLVRLTEEVDLGRDLLASSMEAYLSQINIRLSHVTSRLTLIATIFLPLNFMAGFFGMNLQILPPEVAVPLVIASVAVTPIGMWLYFRRKGWL